MDPGTGMMHRRVIPGIVDVSVAGGFQQVDDSNFARVTVQVRSNIFLRNYGFQSDGEKR